MIAMKSHPRREQFVLLVVTLQITSANWVINVLTYMKQQAVRRKE